MDLLRFGVKKGGTYIAKKLCPFEKHKVICPMGS
jgi:hypothetical protein